MKSGIIDAIVPLHHRIREIPISCRLGRVIAVRDTPKDSDPDATKSTKYCADRAAHSPGTRPDAAADRSVLEDLPAIDAPL
jgi:hypothetical protein